MTMKDTKDRNVGVERYGKRRKKTTEQGRRALTAPLDNTEPH